MTGGAELMIGAVRRRLSDGDNGILMQGGISKDCEVSEGVWQGSTLSSSTFCLTFWRRMAEISWTNRPAAGCISHADALMISTKQPAANATCDKTVEALKEIGLKTHEAASCHSREDGELHGQMRHSNKERTKLSLAHRRRRGNSKGKLNEAILLAEHAETINGLKMDSRKTEARWLITSKSTERALDFRNGESWPR